MIIFLDIDGVLNGGKNGFNTVGEYAKARKQFEEEFGITFLLPDVNVLPFVECVNKYIEQNGENSIKAVLSSTWRYGSENIKLLNNLLHKKDLRI
ncbi:MAG: HAD domain-containing protein [Cetobacterium sp.]